MSTTTLPPSQRAASFTRDAVCTHSVQVLRVTAQQWGMALRAQPQPGTTVRATAARQVFGYGPCARVWAGVALV